MMNKKNKNRNPPAADLVLIPLSGIAVEAAENGEITVPESFALLPYGDIESREYDPFLADEAAFDLIIADQADIGNDLVIDYEHATLSGKEAPAAGWVKRLVNKGKAGLWVDVEWTAKAKAYIAAREYRYFSPVVMKRPSDNRAVMIHSVALTNSPNIKHLEPLVNKAAAELSTSKDKENLMDARIFELLGLKADADADQVITALTELKATAAKDPEPKVPEALIETLGLKANATISEINGTILALKSGAAAGADLVTRITDLEARLAAQAADDLVIQALKAGKITPAQKEWAETYAKSDAPGFKAFVEAAAVIIPLKKLPESDAPESGVLSPEMQQLGTVFGNSDDDLKSQL